MNQKEPTLVDEFIFRFRNADGLLGDYCTDLMNDEFYPDGTDVETQLNYIQQLAITYPSLLDATEVFLMNLQRFQRITL